MIKKIFKTLIILIILLAAGLGAYWYFDRQQGGSGIPLIGEDSNLSLRDLFPFGGGGGDNTPPNEEPTPNGPDTPNQTPDAPIIPARLWQISNDRQSGAVAFNASGTPTVRFVDKATGNIFESPLRLFSLNRVSNTTIPKVYEAMWQPNGNAVVLRYLDENNETIISAYGKLVSSNSSGNSTSTTTTSGANNRLATMPSELQATFLPNNITNLTVNRLGGALAFVVENQNGSVIFTTNATAGATKQVFESAIKDLAVSWVNATTLGVLSKPSADSLGQFYFLKPDTGRLDRVVGGKPGLLALANSDGTKIFYSEARSNSFSSNILDIKTGVTSQIPFVTLADKCVWSTKSPYLYCATPKSIPSAKYPDHWYQGKVSFNDTLWRIDTSSGATEFIIDPVITTEKEFDMTNLILDPNEEYLLFTNKKDSALWGLKIQQGS